MKNTFIKLTGIFAAGILAAGLSSCERADYPDRFRLTEDKPSVAFVRYTSQDVLIEQAYMDEVLCIVGDNLTSVREIWFSDQKALLNTSYITKNTMLVNVPASLPVVNTDQMYLVYGSQKDTLAYPFRVLPPAPVVNSMSNEWAKSGETVTIKGNYFVEDSSNPIVVSFSGVEVPHDDITVSMTELTFAVPAGAPAGRVTVTTYSGTGRSKFQYLDDRNILFDWDGSRGGFAEGYGWRSGAGLVHTPGADGFPALDGNYIVFTSDLQGEAGADWAEDPLSFNYWPDEGSTSAHPELSSLPTFASYIDKYGVGGLTLKFEYLIPASNPWGSCAMQLMFSGNKQVTSANGNNNYFSDATFPRGLWRPWTSAEPYDTGGKWMTASFPLTTFIYTCEGKDSGSVIDKSQLTGLSFFVWHGGVNGTACTPVIAIDNIRVVPAQ